MSPKPFLAALAWLGAMTLAALPEAHAQGTLSRDEVVRRALHVSPELELAEAEHDGALAAIDTTRRFDDPRVSARLWGVPVDFGGRPTQTMLMAEQMLPLAPVRRREGDVMRAQAAVSAASVARMRLEVAEAAERAWLEVCRAEATSAATEGTRALVAQLLEVARARARTSLDARAEVVMLEVEAARLDAELAAQSAMEGGARAILAQRLALPAETLDGCRMPDDDAAPDVSGPPIAREGHPDLLVARAQVERAEARVSAVRAHDAPMVMLGAGVMLMPDVATAHSATTQRASLMLEVGTSVPLFRVAASGRAREAEAEARARRAEAEVRSGALDRRIAALTAAVTAKRQRRAVLEGPVRAGLERAREVSIAHYTATGSFGPLLETLRQQREVEAERVAARFELLEAELELVYATGGRAEAGQ